MTTQEILTTLEKLGTEQARKTYQRHGAKPPLYGVSYANFGALKKKLKTNHALALSLWDSGILDARILAGMIADPQQATVEQCEHWISAVDNRMTCCAAADYVARTPLAKDLAMASLDSAEEWRGTTGWSIVAHLADPKSSLPESYFAPLIRRIERHIHEAENQVRYSMNNALIAIGLRSPALQEKALAAAAKIGKVEVDHGDTSCKTPDAAAYIKKTVEHYARKAAQKKAK